MLFTNLFMSAALGTVVSARAVERSDGSFQRPINDPSPPHLTHSPQTCIFTPSLPMPPVSFTSTLPPSLHHHLPNILLSHSLFKSNFQPSSGSTTPIISTLSLSEETGDASLQGIFLGLVYTSISKSESPSTSPEPKPSKPKSSKPKKSKSKCRPRPPISAVGEQDDFDKSWGHINNHDIRSSVPGVPQSHSSPSMEMRKCYMDAVEGVRESGLVEGMLEFPGEGGRMRFLVWRVH